MMRLISLFFCLLLLAGCAGEPERKIDPIKAAEANASLGLRYMQQGNYQVALDKLQKALEFNPKSLEAHHYMAELYRRLDEQEKADDYFRQALRLAPDNTPLQNNYGVFLCESGRYDEAERQFLEVLDNPVYGGKAQTNENLGLCLLEGDPVKAEQYLRQALSINPQLPKSLLTMSALMLEQNNHLSARAYLQRYLEVGRHTPRSLWLGIRIERVLGDQDALASYGLLLKNNFPDAEETRLYLESQ